MDLILYNGAFKTMDDATSAAEAVAVKNGVIVKVGKNEDILCLAKKNTQTIDLQGKLALPGFTESHMHLIYYADTKHRMDLSGVKSIESVIELGRQALSKRSQGDTWLLGWGWNQDDWETSGFPTRNDLDKISAEVPIAITRVCYHVTVINTKGLELLGITKDMPHREKDFFEYDEEGNPNGILREKAQKLLWDSMGEPSLEEIKGRITDACIDALKQGITAIYTDDFEAFSRNSSEIIMKAYAELAREKKLPIRICQQCLLRTPEALQNFLNQGYKTGVEEGFYKIGPLKLVNDGSLGARTASLRHPYRDDPATKGIALYTRDELAQMVKMGHDHGMQLAIHCIGDAALEMAIDCLEEVMHINPRPDPRHGIVHCQITDMPLLERMSKLNLIAYIQPIFVQDDHSIVDERVGHELAATSYNWRGMIDLGIPIAGSSDCPVDKFDVLPNIYCAVTRKDFAGQPEAGWYPENCISMDEAVRAFTQGGAYAAFQEHARGSISVGKYADLVVLEENIYEIPVDHVKDVNVSMTIVNGEIKYTRA